MDVTVQEAKTHLSRLLRRVEAGESIVIRRGPHRIAVLNPLSPQNEDRHLWGDLRGSIGADFDDSLTDFDAFQ